MRDLQRLHVLKLDGHHTQHTEDEVVVEEPLEVRVNGDSISVTMRTPGGDFDLAAGFLWTEGIIRSSGEIGTIAYCAEEEQPELKNVVNVVLADVNRKLESSRASWSNSSCGLCGKATLDAIRRRIDSPLILGGALGGKKFNVNYALLCTLPTRLRESQANFDRTGGIHAAGLFDASGNLFLLREDLGRHNAVDKVLGAALRAGHTPLSESIMLVSGRLGFEIAQKALVARIPIVASVSAPSSLAIQLANEFGMTAIGFLRGRSMNIYTHPERVERFLKNENPITKNGNS